MRDSIARVVLRLATAKQNLEEARQLIEADEEEIGRIMAGSLKCWIDAAERDVKAAVEALP